MGEGPVVIEPAGSAHIDAVHRIERASFPAPWRREFFLSELTADGRYNLVAKLGGEVVGYLFAMWIFDEMHVNKIAVDPGARRRGIAGALMARCFTFAREQGVETISLEVRKSNDAAREFYRQLEFEPAFLRKRYYPDGEAAVVMVRRL
ncbi:MAG TPA: ribosomal protein S18-alanine N-acetyltransferase [Thermoanaerobaculia bacterium]|nr:ribosomal protein S18-alanine N-acetyltransferase [Thermoanaerobaculia bacterium]